MIINLKIFVTFRHFKNTMITPSVKFLPKYSGNEYELRIGRAKLEDQGEYIVKAINSFGGKQESGYLTVERELPFLTFYTSRQQFSKFAWLIGI